MSPFFPSEHPHTQQQYIIHLLNNIIYKYNFRITTTISRIVPKFNISLQFVLSHPSKDIYMYICVWHIYISICSCSLNLSGVYLSFPYVNVDGHVFVIKIYYCGIGLILFLIFSNQDYIKIILTSSHVAGFI